MYASCVMCKIIRGKWLGYIKPINKARLKSPHLTSGCNVDGMQLVRQSTNCAQCEEEDKVPLPSFFKLQAKYLKQSSPMKNLHIYFPGRMFLD